VAVGTGVLVGTGVAVGDGVEVAAQEGLALRANTACAQPGSASGPTPE